MTLATGDDFGDARLKSDEGRAAAGAEDVLVVAEALPHRFFCWWHRRGGDGHHKQTA